MAVTVTDDFTTIKDMDNATGVTRVGTGDPFGGNPTADSNVQAQGTASCGRVPNTTGIGGFDFDTGAANVDVTDEHILMWAYPAAFVWSWLAIQVSSGADAASNMGRWEVTTPDDALAITEGAWIILAVDVLKPFDATNGTPPAITAIRSFAAMVNITTVVAEASKYYVDEYKRGTGITITGGAATPRGSTEVAVNDKTNGRGTFIDASGAFYVMGRITIGDVTAATNSAFDDTNKTWVWQDLPVSATFHMLEFVGGTGTNRVTFGTSSGTGSAKEGSSGNAFIAGGIYPFHVKATNANVTAETFGCSFVGTSALRDDAVRNFKVEDNSAASFTDDTRDANDAGASDANVFPNTGAGTDDAVYFGHDERFSLLKINTGTAGVGTYTVTWEYYNGTAWASLIDLTDGTSNFKTTGLQTVSYAISDDWAKTTVDTDNRYWIRARRDAGTLTTIPAVTQCFASMGGIVEWEQANAESIRCTYTNKDMIRVRSTAKLKKAVIVDSVAPAKSGAINMGNVNPGQNVRDLTINGGINGSVFQPAASGHVIDLRNWKFAGQSGKKVRIEGPSGRTVTVNTLEGGDSLLSSDLDLAGGITTGDVTIVNNPVTVKVHVDDNTGASLQNANVWLKASDGTGDLPYEQSITSITRSGTTATVTFAAAHGLKSNDYLKLSGITDKTEDNNGAFQVTVTSTTVCTYTTTNSGSTNYTGTIVGTGGLLYGLTDINGDISVSRAFALSQPVDGFVRKSTSSPRFKTFPLAGNTVTTSADLTINVRMVLDE